MLANESSFVANSTAMVYIFAFHDNFAVNYRGFLTFSNINVGKVALRLCLSKPAHFLPPIPSPSPNCKHPKLSQVTHGNDFDRLYHLYEITGAAAHKEKGSWAGYSVDRHDSHSSCMPVLFSLSRDSILLQNSTNIWPSSLHCGCDLHSCHSFVCIYFMAIMHRL